MRFLGRIRFKMIKVKANANKLNQESVRRRRVNLAKQPTEISAENSIDIPNNDFDDRSEWMHVISV